MRSPLALCNGRAKVAAPGGIPIRRLGIPGSGAGAHGPGDSRPHDIFVEDNFYLGPYPAEKGGYA
jgi:hypothetical protein